MIKLYVSIFFLLAISTFVSAQTITITGQVIDDDTEEGQPFASIQLKGTTLGTATDVDGFYTLKINTSALTGKDSILITAIGYQRNIKPITNAEAQIINFRIKPADYALNEVVILAGENPANRIVKKIIQNKDKNRPHNLPYYKVQSYTKTELDLDNFSDEFKKRKIMKPFAFVFDNVDSVSDVKPFLPAYLFEELADVYYTQKSGTEKHVPLARQVSGIENESLQEFINSMHEQYDLYDNWYEMLAKKFTGPFNNNALLYYEYYIMDSAMVKDRWSYKLKFKPRRSSELTFFGEFWVDMKSYAVEIINMRMTPDANVNFIERVILYNESDLYQDSIWLPSKEKAVIDFYSTKKSPGIIGRKTITYKGYQFDDPDIEKQYDKQKPDAIDPNTLIKADTFWDKNRHEVLSKNEASVYKMIDSIQAVPIYKTYLDVVKTAFTGYKEFGPIKIGPYFSAFSSNPVEGWRFRLGVGTTTKLSDKYKIYAYGAYGLKDKAWKYGGEFQYNLTRRPFSFVGIGYRNDIDLTNENSEEPGEDNLLAGLYRRKVPQKLLKMNEAKLFYQKGWNKGWSTRVTTLYRRMIPYGGNQNFNFRYQRDLSDPTSIDTAIVQTEVILKLRYAYKEKFIDNSFSQSSLGTKFPVVELQYTAGIPKVMNSQYDYHKLTLFYTHWFDLPPIGWFKYSLKAVKTWGTIPYLLMEVHNGNETYFYLNGAFNGMNRFEFVSDQSIQLLLEHHFDGFFLNRIPLIKKLKWREVVGFRTVYGTLTDENRAANAGNNYDRTQSQAQPGEGVFYGTFDKNRPYMEAHAGIENIFRFIRIDALWRLNYLDARYAPPFTLRGTAVFYF